MTVSEPSSYWTEAEKCEFWLVKDMTPDLLALVCSKLSSAENISDVCSEI